MAEASTIGFTTDSVDGKSSTMHAASDQLIDPYCELHNGNINDRYCHEHHEMLCSECLKQNHQRCHVDTITDLCKILGSDDIKSFTGVVDDIKLNVQNTQSKLQKNISDLTKERENEIKRAEQAKQDMIQKANEMYNETFSGITKHYHNKVGEIKSYIVGLTDERHNLDEIINKLNRKASIKFDPNLFIQMQQIVNTTQKFKREIDEMISEIKTTKISFSFSKEISDVLSCKSFGDIQEISSPLISQMMSKISSSHILHHRRVDHILHHRLGDHMLHHRRVDHIFHHRRVDDIFNHRRGARWRRKMSSIYVIL